VEPAANPLETSVNLKGVLELLLKSAELRDMEQVGVAVVGVTVGVTGAALVPSIELETKCTTFVK
jgi:hypothetical protein